MTERLGYITAIFALLIPSLVKAQTQPPPLSIVLPPRLLANAPATLAILGADGHLAPGVTVDIGNGQFAVTDPTGRASFTAPPDGAFIASAAGVSAAALVDAPQGTASQTASVAPDVSQRDRFAVCGSGFHGDVANDSVTINGDPAFVLAASPLCVIVLPQSRTLAGHANVTVDAGAAHTTAITNLVALDFVPPNPALLPGHKGKLFVRATGSADALQILAENSSPNVIHFLRGETQELRTSGGAQNEVALQVEAIRSGAFSFHARILPPPDVPSAIRYLEIAEGIAPKNALATVKSLSAQLARHPRDSASTRAALDHIAEPAAPGAFHTLIAAASAALD
jgi:hypothetical protein